MRLSCPYEFLACWLTRKNSFFNQLYTWLVGILILVLLLIYVQCLLYVMKSARSEAMLQFESPVGMISVYVDNEVFVL